jgi:hypothetical protein
MDGEHLYHVTYYARLASIEETGLAPGHEGSIGVDASMGHHKKDRLFLTDAEGIAFWYGRAEDWADHRSDNIMSDELVPVILKVPVPDNFEEVFILDPIGTRESRGEAWMGPGYFDPEDIEILYGLFRDQFWYPLDEWRDLDVETAFDDDGYMFYNSKNPFYWSS